MKKFVHLFCFALCSVLLLAVSSCKVHVENNQTDLGSGTIIGRVFYSNNMSDNTGIHVLLVPSDGLRAVSSVDRRVTASAAEVDEVVSDKDGKYTFTNVPVGTYSIYASFSSTTERAVITRISVKKDETSIANDLSLTQTGSISGVITLDDSLTNNGGFTVFIGGTTFVGKTDLKGKFKIDGIPAAKDYELFIEKGLFTYYKGTVSVTPDNETQIGTVNFTSEQINASIPSSGGQTGETGQTGQAGKDGKDGISIVWKGSFESASEIENPQYAWAYYNSTDGCSYIYDGTQWTLLAKAGAQGEKGETGQKGDKGDKGDTGANGSTGSNGSNGANGASIVWRGEFAAASAVENPVLLNAYYNTTDGCSYIYTTSGWTLLAKAGAQGEKGDTGEKGATGEKGETGAKGDTGANGAAGSNGTNGSNGASIIWRGSFASASAVENPVLLNAYYNTTDGCSYIYTSEGWTLLAKAGADGLNGDKGDKGDKGDTGADGAIAICYINYVLNGGALGAETPNYVLHGETATLVAAERVGYVFSGWYDNSELTGTPLSSYTADGTAASITLYAKWRLNNTTAYTITLDNQDAATAGSTGFTVKCGSIIDPITVPEKTGYLFNGYYTEKAGQGVKCINEDGTGNGTWSVTGDRSLYAYWTPILYRIYLNNQEATTDGSLYTELNYGAKLPDIIIPGKTGLVFMGYYTEANGAGTKYYDDKGHGLLTWTDTAVNTLYALWVESSSVAVSGLRNFLTNVVASEGPYYLKIADKNPDLSELSSILKTYEHIKVILDFSACTELTAITESAFEGVNGIVEVRTGGSITTIEKKAFYQCTSLEKVILGNNVSTIGISAFSRCSKLHTVEMGDSVSDIGNGAFYLCTNLVNVTLGESVTSIGSTAFEQCSKLESIILPESLTSIGKSAFQYCEKLKSIVIPDNVVSVGESAFYCCRQLESVTIGNSVETIGDKAFYDCEKLAGIYIPESVTSIGSQVFRSCYNIKSIEVALANTVYESLESNVIIEEATRTLKSGCTNSTIPANTLIIDDYAFYYYRDLTAITIPSSVTEIRSYAFASTGLTSVTLPANLTVLGAYAFYSSKLTTIKIPSSVKEIGDYAFNNCDKMTSVNLGSVEVIGEYAFANTGLTAVTIPTTVKKIGSYAFAGTKITSVTIPSTVKWIGQGVFYSSSLSSATFSTYTNWYYTSSKTYWESRTGGSAAGLSTSSTAVSALKQTGNYYYYYYSK